MHATGSKEGIMQAPDNDHKQNRILAELPAADYQRISAHIEPVHLTHGQIIYEIDQAIEYAYFPHHSMISLVTIMEDGKIVEVGMVGRDGMTGIAALMGRRTSAERAVVQIPNGGVRVRFDVIKEEFERGGSLQKILLDYVYKFLRQVSQTAACNATHTAEQRLSRWLLMCQDRVQSDQLNLTQEFIAEMLATRRATVNIAATNLQSAGLIRYNRADIRIIDRPGLAAYSCECYETVKRAGGN